jgi:hypothetical protein
MTIMSTHGFLRDRFGRPGLWMLGSFLVAAALVVPAIFSHQGAGLALRTTARWSFLLFWLAYSGPAIATIGGPSFNGLARYRRELGLSFASAHLIHVLLILWARVGSGMIFFWVGILCTYLLALFSVPRFQGILGLRLWRIFLSIALNYIALVFATDFILLPLEADGVGKYPLSYLPFTILLVGGVALRVTAFWYKKWQHLRQPAVA